VKAFELQKQVLSDYLWAEALYNKAVLEAMKKRGKGKKKC
jgi:hypothetical protein